MSYLEQRESGWRVGMRLPPNQLVRFHLGKITKTQAKAIKLHFDALATRRKLGIELPPSTQLWIGNLSLESRLYRQLVDNGLIEPQAVAINETLTVEQYAARFLEQYTKRSAANSVKRMHNTINWLIAELGTKQLDQVTEGDCDRFSWNLHEQHSTSHAGKLVRDCRQIFKQALRDRVISRNPFDGITTSGKQDATREVYVSRATVEAVIAECDEYYGAVLAFARFAGFRCPSEHLQLEWQNIKPDRLTVYSPKIKQSRTLPLFDELRPHLDNLRGNHPQYVFHRARASATKQFRLQILKAIKQADIKPWPKLFVNLRASCSTDLKASKYPAHVVHYFLGHSQQVSDRHYNRIDERWYE